MHSEGGRPRDQQQAICFSQWRKRGKGVIDEMEFKRFIPISKVDEEKRMVYGWASTPDLDSQGEIVSVEGLKKALPDYMQFPAIREMHQPKAAGVTKEAVTNEKGLFIGAKIVADDAWKMIKEKVYRGFSVGGKIKQKVDNVITDLALSEISLVDVPANRNTVFTLVKREGEKLVDVQKDIYSASRLAQLAEEISFKIDSYISRGKDASDLEEALKRLKTVIGKELKEKEDRSAVREMAPKSAAPKWVQEQHESMAKYMPNWKEVNAVNDLEKKHKKVEEELVEEAETEETPQAPEETPEAPKTEVEETKETTETPVSEGSPQVGETVVDETKQTSESPEDITKRLEKLEKTLMSEPKTTKEEEAMAKVVARFDTQIAKVASIVEKLAGRLDKVEKMAAPVKAKPSYLVEKGEDKPESEEVQTLEKRLEELRGIADKDPQRYQRDNLQKEAFDLVDKLRKLRS
jgi:hypothetical protein